MKKFFTFALAAATLVGFNACMNEEDGLDANKGYINLGVTIDDAVVTRATQNATVADWYALVTNSDGDAVFGTLPSTKALIGTTLSSTALTSSKTYNIAVSNFEDDDDWLTANDGFGAAYYEGNASSVSVSAGATTNVPIACGKAKNKKFAIVSSGFSGTALAVNVSAPRALTFSTSSTPSTIGKVAFFDADDNALTYTITYTINGITKTSAAKNFPLGAAGSASTLTIASNQNGTISVTITYDDDYTSGEGQTITIDAGTGVEV